MPAVRAAHVSGTHDGSEVTSVLQTSEECFARRTVTSRHEKMCDVQTER